MEPSCLAIVLCDYVIEDKATNNKSLIGLFNRVNATDFPCQHPRMVIFISLTDGRGPTILEVFLERAENRDEIFKAEGNVDFKDPNHVIDIVFDLRGVTFKEPGTHFVGIRTKDGRPLGERKFHVIHMKEEPPAPTGEGPIGGLGNVV
ncbi:MAG: DUF6941 family protein [Planctomycetota bacterium]|jgi:hypothetical protein